MNSKFYLGLKKVRYSYKDYPNASDELFEYYNELIEEINKHQLNTNEALTKYVVQAYNQITEEQKRIIKWCESIGKKDIKALSKTELKELDINENYFKEILSISNDARAICLEHLATYCPEMFETIDKQKLLREMLPFSIVAKSVLNSHDNSTNIKYIETYKKEVTPERIEKLKSELAEIASNEDKISFLKNKNFEYLQNVSPELYVVSGSTSYPNFKPGQPLFFDRFIQLEIDKLTHALPPKQMNTEQETPTFTNNFDNIKPIEIYEHFKAGLVDKGYLTIEELNKYLKAAFELKTIPETLFKLKHTPTKQKIYTVFYIYYKDISQKKHERQKEYAALLGDFFEGYKTEIIQTNWARDYKKKR